MRTIVIWDTDGVEPIQFFVLDGNYQHLNRVYINSMEDDGRQEELDAILGFDDTGRPTVEMLDDFPLPLQPDDIVIVAGFLP